MSVVARAPGKLVIIGEYAVLVGAPALAMAVDRHATATLAPSPDAECHLVTSAEQVAEWRFAADATSGVGIVDLIARRWPHGTSAPWSGHLDTRRLHGAGHKLGLGSSAAAAVAWSGAWAAWAGAPPPPLAALIEVHRAWQGGTGSGLDVAASLLGGVVAFVAPVGDAPEAVSVALPDGVGFVVVFSGRSARTRRLVEQFQAWRAARPASCETLLGELRDTAAAGVDAARTNAARPFLEAIAAYGRGLAALGSAMGGGIMTPMHAAVASTADRYGVVYKVSGAGGGDTGLAFAADTHALDGFVAALPPGCGVLRLHVDPRGLVIEENAA